MLNVTQHFKAEIHSTLSHAFDKVIQTFNHDPSITSDTSPNNYATTGSEYADSILKSDFTDFFLPTPYNLTTLDTAIKSLDDKEIE